MFPILADPPTSHRPLRISNFTKLRLAFSKGGIGKLPHSRHWRVPTRRARWFAGARFLPEDSKKLPMDERGPEIRCHAWDRQLWRHAGLRDGGPLLAGW